MKIYTKTGDKGFTSLFGGTRVSKTHPRLEAYGSVDELMAHIGLLHDISPTGHEKQVLLDVLDHLMITASMLATDPLVSQSKAVCLSGHAITRLEQEIDSIVPTLPILNKFILPCGHATISQAHVARTVCRRAERNIIKLSGTVELDEKIIRYVNRLSDYLFILARYWAKELKVTEICWESEL